MTQEEIQKGLDTLAEKIKGEVVSKKELETMQGEFKALNEKIEGLSEKAIDPEKVKNIELSLNDMAEKMEKNASKQKSYKSIKDFASKSIKERLTSDENNAAIANAIKGRGDFTLLNLDSKAVGEVTTLSVADSGTFSALHHMVTADEIQGLQFRVPSIEQFASVERTSKPTYAYVEFEPKDGDAAIYAEGDASNQIDLKATVRQVNKVKVGAHTILTEEAADDIPRMQSEAGVNLAGKTMLAKQNDILFRTGVSNVQNGLTLIANAFTGTHWEAQYNVDSPTNYDAMVAAATQIYMTENYTDEAPAMANVVYVNPVDLAGMKVERDNENRLLYPELRYLDGTNVIENMNVIPHKDIPKGYFLMGDFSKLKIINYKDYVSEIGRIGDQFIEDTFTIKGKTEYFSFVKEFDKRAFIYDTFANVKDAIKTVAIEE